MEILFRNPGTPDDEDDQEIDYDDWQATRFLDPHRANQFSIKCHRRNPVLPYAKITAKEGAKIHFRGYVSQRGLVWKNKTLVCKGDEDLLLRRTTGRAHYLPDTTRLVHLFKSDPPNQTADEYGITWNCGQLFLANSKMPDTPWALEDAASWTWRLDGAGTNSRIGTRDIYVLSGVTAIKLTERASLAECKANNYSSYRTATALYIQISPVDEAYFACILAANAFDTGCSKGIVDNPEIVLANVQCNDDKPWEVLISMGNFYEQPPRVRYGADRTYIDSVEDDGSDDAIFDLAESDCVKPPEMAESNDRYCHALTGLGYGSRDCRHRYTKMDLSYKGIWYQDIFEVENGFGLYDDAGGLLVSMTDDEYARRRANEFWKAETKPSWENRPNPGHYLNLILQDELGRKEAVHKLRIESIGIRPNGVQIFELGRRLDDIIDAFNPKSALSDVYMYEYLDEFYTPDSCSGDIQLGDSVHGLCGGYSCSTTVPADVDDAGNNHRVTIDISIQLKDSNTHILGPATVYLLVGGTQSPQHVFKHYMIGDTISGVDVTNKMNYGSATPLAVYCQFQGNWLPSHANCSGHPTATCNLTIHAYKRIS